ncbi:MAG TPA: hypothetical protein VLC93_06615, partial [Myxococcota bacterium]|nr:hypothetical protein [Myxococcota bacterium]
LTLASMQKAVDNLQSAESRARSILTQATRPFGKDGQTWFTRLADSPAPLAVAGAVGLTAAALIAYKYFPAGSAYAYSNYYGWTHRVADSWYYKDAGLILGGALAAGASATVGVKIAIERIVAREKTRMADALLEGKHLRPFVELGQEAAERPLERAAIGKVARQTLEALKTREVWFAPEVKATLERAKEDEGIGDANAREEAARHGAVITAIRDIETNRGDILARVNELLGALDALPPVERAITKDIHERLFDGVRPRNKNIPYTTAHKLAAKLGSGDEA